MSANASVAARRALSTRRAIAIRALGVEILATLRRASRALPVLIALVVYFEAYDHNRLLLIGDEPHYVVEAHSLAEDFDRDLRNNYANRTVMARFTPLLLTPADHAFRYTSSPRVVSVHNVGLPLLVSPVAAVDDGVDRIRIELIVVAALGAWLLWSLLRALQIAGWGWTSVVWATIAFSAPLLLFSDQVFPELPAATLILLALRMLVVRAPRRWQLIVAGLAIGALPWLHVRYLLLAVPLAVALAIRAGARSGLPRRRIEVTRARRALAWTRTNGWVLILPVLSLLAMAVGFWSWYGSPLPNAQYQTPPTPAWFEITTLSHRYSTSLGSLLGSESGLLPTAPVCILAVAALGLVVWRYRWWGALGVLACTAYFVVISTGGWGYSFPARLLVPILPVAAIPLLLAIRELWPVRVMFIPLAVLTLALARDAFLHAAQWYPTGAGYVTTNLGKKIRTAWPDLLARPNDAYPDAALVLVWIGGMLLVGMLMVAAVRSRGRDGPRAR